MEKLLDWYNSGPVTLDALADLHASYESIHPFQDGNGRTGRMVLFRECLANGIVPFIIQDKSREEYRQALVYFRENNSVERLVTLFEKEQQEYLKECRYFFPEIDQALCREEPYYDEDEYEL